MRRIAGLAALHAVRERAASASFSVRAEYGLALALAHYRRRDFDIVEEVLCEVSTFGGLVHARAVMFRGFVAIQCSDYRAAVTLFKHAVELHERSGAVDVLLELNLARALSYIAAETLDRPLWLYVDERARRRELLAHGRCASRYGLQDARAIQYETLGCPGDALRAAREAALAAPTEQMRLSALCRRATIHYRYGEQLPMPTLRIPCTRGFERSHRSRSAPGKLRPSRSWSPRFVRWSAMSAVPLPQQRSPHEQPPAHCRRMTARAAGCVPLLCRRRGRRNEWKVVACKTRLSARVSPLRGAGLRA